jgi:hypothetical protein
MEASMKVFRIAALALFVPCVALANTTDDARAGGAAIIGNVGMSIDVVGNSSLQNHTGSSHAIDMGFSVGKAKGKQDREVGDQPIIFGNTPFLGAAGDIDWTSNIRIAHIGYRPRFWFGQSQFAIEGVIGAGWAGLGVKGVAANGQTASEQLSNGGGVFGLGGIWRFASATALQLRALQFVSGDKEGVTRASHGEVSVTHALGKNFQIRGGLGFISAYSARENGDSSVLKSPIRAGGFGLVLGVDFVF